MDLSSGIYGGRLFGLDQFDLSSAAPSTVPVGSFLIPHDDAIGLKRSVSA